MSQSCHKFIQLSIIDRTKIELLNDQGFSLSYIARHIGRAKSTISSELRNHRYKARYRAITAQNQATKTKQNNRKPKKANNQELMQQIERMLKLRLSPEIIAHELGGIISHTTIYSMTKTIRREWKKHLIYQKKIRYHKGGAGKTLIPNRTDISLRPNEVVFGDYEADTVVSARGGKACLGVFVERTTRLYRVVKMANKSAAEMTRATLKALSGEAVNSITYDNGTENAEHWVTNKLLNCASYFCRPYRSGDKGLIENRNRWLRVWLPKGEKFDLISEEELSKVERAINERPMKCLGWQSPLQAFQKAQSFGFKL
jgi:IS30 family transposase